MLFTVNVIVQKTKKRDLKVPLKQPCNSESISNRERLE